MKKLVLSAVAAAALLSGAGSAFAKVEPQMPTLKINGNTIFNIYFVNQHFHKNGKSHGHHFENSVSDLVFSAFGETNRGIKYGYRVAFETISNSHPIVKQNYIEFIVRDWVFQMGNVVGPEDTIAGKDASALIGGAGGFDGSLHHVFNFAALSMRGNDNIGDTGYATKIVVYTPRWYGFMLGVAYTPDTSHLGDARMDTNSIKGNPHVPGERALWPSGAGANINAIGVHNWAFGLDFTKQINNWGINLTAAYITEESHLDSTNPATPDRDLHDTSAYQLSAMVGYKLACGGLVQVAGGYLNNHKSRRLKAPLGAQAVDFGFANPGADDSMYRGNSGRSWNIGTAYTQGAYKFAAAYQNTERKPNDHGKARNDIYSLTADVVPVGGLKFYAEVDHIRSRSSQSAVDIVAASIDGGLNSQSYRPTRKNSGMVYVIGTKVSF